MVDGDRSVAGAEQGQASGEPHQHRQAALWEASVVAGGG